MGPTLLSQKVLSPLSFRNRFNEYSDFKKKSFQYQTLLGKLHLLPKEDEENSKRLNKKIYQSPERSS